MNTVQLECFIAVAESLSFARAAEKMNITQPAVTGQIHSLEGELGTRLFKRTTRSVELTESGLIFLNDARSMLNISHKAIRRFQDKVTDVKRELVIGCHAHREIFFLTRALEAFHKAFPDIAPVIRTVPVPFMHVYQQLAEENLDVVIAYKEDTGKKPLIYEELTCFPLVAVVRKDNPLSRKHSLDADDLASQPLVISNPHTCPPSVDDLQHRMIQEHSTKNIILADSIEGVSVLAEAGFGIGLIPGPALAEGQSVRCIPVRNSSVLSYGIYRSRTCEKEEAMAFIQMMKDCFSPS